MPMKISTLSNSIIGSMMPLWLWGFVFFLVGLTYSEAAKLDNYLHFSTPKNRKKKSLLEIGDLNPAIDFLDDISEDIPKSETIFFYKYCSPF